MSLADWHQRYLQQSQWTQAIRRHLLTESDIHPSDRILEVGSGTGAVLTQVAAEYDSRTFGIDINIRSLDFSRKKNPDFILAQADGHHLPFQDNAFAISYCHYLLMWVEDPLAVLGEMQRVTRPGGSVIALAESDYAARIDYPPPLDRLGELQTHSLVSQGVDIRMGRQLGNLFNQAGLDEIETGVLGARWHGESAANVDKTEWATLRSDLEGVLTETELDYYQKVDTQAREKAERVLFIPTFYAIGTPH